MGLCASDQVGGERRVDAVGSRCSRRRSPSHAGRPASGVTLAARSAVVALSSQHVRRSCGRDVTAILGVFETAAFGPGERAFCDALSSALGRAGDRVRLQIEPPAILGVAHRAPEPASGLLQPPSFAVDDDFVYVVVPANSGRRSTSFVRVRRSASPFRVVRTTHLR